MRKNKKRQQVIYDPIDYDSDFDSSIDDYGSDNEMWQISGGYKGLTLENVNHGPNKKLLVLSLGGVLCQTFYRYVNLSKLPKARIPDGAFRNTLVYKRPHCEEFMKFCLERFQVAIWTSPSIGNVDRVLKYIMRDLRHELLFVRDQNDCTETGFNTLENNRQSVFLKELNQVWVDVPYTEFSSSNTLLIDHQPFTAVLNPPYTSIFPSEYIVDKYPNDDALGPNSELRLYLEGLAQAEDVPSYVKEHPFGSPEISAMHPDWNYYCNITRSVLDKRTPTNAEGKSSTSSCKRTPIDLESSKLKGKLTVFDNDTGKVEGDSSRDNELRISLEKLSLWPRKQLLVLSIGGVLCQRGFSYDKSRLPDSDNHRPDGAYGKTLVYMRPYCEEFLEFCFERFEVGVWSSAIEWNVDMALDCIMVGLRNKLLFVLDQKACTNTGFMTVENNSKPLFLKKLDTIWDLKLKSGQFSSTNTLLVDTEPCKALLNPPYTAIFPTECTADSLPHDDALGPNGELRMYLEKLAEANDVPSYVKDHPFGKAAISDVHPDWSYYSKVICSLGKQ